MKLKSKAAVGSLLVSGALAGAAVMPPASHAHGNTGPLCYGNETYSVMMWSPAGVVAGPALYYNEAFRIKETVVGPDGQFYSLGHSTGTYPVDYWVWTPSLRC